MRKPTKVLLHHDRTHDLADKLKERFPTIEIGECNTYENLPDVIATFEPDVVYAIRSPPFLQKTDRAGSQMGVRAQIIWAHGIQNAQLSPTPRVSQPT
jgi:hypothetical protein